METRYLVLACKTFADRVGAVLADTTDRPTADRAFLDSPKSRDEWVVLIRFAPDCPDGRETSSRF